MHCIVMSAPPDSVLPLSSPLQALPPLLPDVLAALASHPAAAEAAPELHAFAVDCLPALLPEAAAQLAAARELGRRKAGLLAAVERLAAAPHPALAGAFCCEVQQQLAALELLTEAEAEHAVGAATAAAVRHSGVAPAANLACSLMLHHRQHVRRAVMAALSSRQHVGEGALAALLLQPAVAGSLVMALVGSQPREHEQQMAAELLQAAAAADPASCGRAFLPWEAWLLCRSLDPVTGPSVATVLQLVAPHKRTAWQHMAPLAQGLFLCSPPVAAEAASQLHALLAQHRPAAAATMLFNLPFDGMLAPAGGVSGSAGRAGTAAAASLFTAADVQGLLSVVGNPSLHPELVATALSQLAQVAGDPRFAPLLTAETGECTGLRIKF